VHVDGVLWFAASWLAGLALFVGLCVIEWRVGTRGAASRAAPDPPPFADWETTLDVQVLFAVAEQTEVVVDCITTSAVELGPGEWIPVGAPISVRGELPYSASWIAAATESVLRQWADDAVPVEMVLRDSASGPRVLLSHDDTRLQFPIAA